MRAVSSLESLGLQPVSQMTAPILSATASEQDLEARLNDIKQLCPGVDFSPQGVDNAMRFRTRVAKQLQHLEATKRLWLMRVKDIQALIPFYEEVLKIYQELRVVFLCA
jgi:hypothetical protein